VRRSSAEIRRAIDKAREAADACQAHREEEDLAERAVHLYAVDLLRWTAGEPGTRFGKWLSSAEVYCRTHDLPWQPNSKVREIDKGAKG
jgi:hypothetical protein